MASKLTRQDVPLAAFELARSRTEGLIAEMSFFYMQGKHIRPGDALGDALANAYLQGVNDTAAVMAKFPLGYDHTKILRDADSSLTKDAK